MPLYQLKSADATARDSSASRRSTCSSALPPAALRITSVGVPLKIEPFDEFGRRTFSMQTNDGVIHVIQGITRVTPTYTELKGLVAEKSYQWDTKIPTNSLPAPLLSKILRRQAGNDPDMRQAIVRLYIEADAITMRRRNSTST